MAITVTEPAAGQVKQFMETQGTEEGAMLRMSIAGGGCAGLRYDLRFDTEFDPTVDAKYDHHGISVVTSKNMALHLDGTTIDFKEGPAGSGFVIDNPNAPQGGGCPGCGGH